MSVQDYGGTLIAKRKEPRSSLTGEEQKKVAWLFLVCFFLPLGASLFYSIFGEEQLIPRWFGLAGICCLPVGGLLYILGRPTAGYMAVFVIAVGFMAGSGGGIALTTLY